MTNQTDRLTITATGLELSLYVQLILNDLNIVNLHYDDYLSMKNKKEPFSSTKK